VVSSEPSRIAPAPPSDSVSACRVWTQPCTGQRAGKRGRPFTKESSAWFFLVNGSWPRVTACTFYDFSADGGVGSIQSNVVCDAGTRFKGVNRIINYISNVMGLILSGWLALCILLGLLFWLLIVFQKEVERIENNRRS
jgi:hypothetical protein